MFGATIISKLACSHVWRLMLANGWDLHSQTPIPGCSMHFLVLLTQDVGFQEKAYQETQAEAVLPFIRQPHLLESQALPDGSQQEERNVKVTW